MVVAVAEKVTEGLALHWLCLTDLWYTHWQA